MIAEGSIDMRVPKGRTWPARASEIRERAPVRRLAVMAALLTLCGCRPAVALDSTLSPSACIDTASKAPLTEYRSPAVALRLPAGAAGPFVGVENDDYRWDLPGPSIWLQFDRNPADWKAMSFGRIAVGDAAVTLYRWRDYSDVDRILGDWPKTPARTRAVMLSVPLDDESCAAVAKAIAIIASVRFINDEHAIRIERPTKEDGQWQVVVVNELGERRTLRVGDIVTSNNGQIAAIDAAGIVVRRYDRSRNAWIKKRIPAAQTP